MFEDDALKNAESHFPGLTLDGLPGDPLGCYARKPVKVSERPEQFARAVSFIKAGAPGRNSAHSYALKHDAERWIEDSTGVRAYVSNGAMIAAAFAMGWAVKPNGLNAWLAPAANR